MNRSRVGVFLLFISATGAPAQNSTESDNKQDAALRKTQRLLDEPLIESKQFQNEMPLAQFLETVEKHLPKDKKLTLRIERDAFGEKQAEVAATLIRLPALPQKTSLRSVLNLIIAKTKTTDYRVGATGVVLTTPKQAAFTEIYDLRGIVEKPDIVGLSGAPFRNAEPAQKAALIVQSIVRDLDQKASGADRSTIEVLNGTRLVIHAKGTRHAEIASWVQAFRRIGDLTVTTKARLYEVDDEFYQKLKNAKRIPVEEAEKLFLDGIPSEWDSLFKLLQKQKLILTGDLVQGDNGLTTGLLSKHQAVHCLLSPQQLRQGEKGQQTVLEGVGFMGELRVSSDRRYIGLKLTEKSVELQEIRKVKVWGADDKPLLAEVPLVQEATHSQSLESADGGSILIPVHYRPRSVRDKERWWVLTITSRIIMEEEEKRILIGTLTDLLPKVVADVLKNPGLKATREFYGSPDDRRFALLNSNLWTWPTKDPLAIAEHQLTPAKRAGQRLLGIRVDKVHFAQDESGKSAITLTLLNAGGSANGAVIGGCTIRYTYQPGNKAWVLDTAEPLQR